MPPARAEAVQMPFQIVELALDSNDNVVERRVVPYPYQTREEAVDTIESVVTRFAEAGYEPEECFLVGNCWLRRDSDEVHHRRCLKLLRDGRRLRPAPLFAVSWPC